MKKPYISIEWGTMRTRHERIKLIEKAVVMAAQKHEGKLPRDKEAARQAA